MAEKAIDPGFFCITAHLVCAITSYHLYLNLYYIYIYILLNIQYKNDDVSHSISLIFKISGNLTCY